MLIVGGFASGKRSFIESHFLHKSLQLGGCYMDGTISNGFYTLKYADEDHICVSIRREYKHYLEDDKSLCYKIDKIGDNWKLNLSLDEFQRLYHHLSLRISEIPIFDDLTVYINNPFFKIFDIEILNPWLINDSFKLSEVYNSADVVIYLMNACHCCTRDEMELLSQINHPNFLVVVNRFDMVRKDEIDEYKKFISLKLKQLSISNIQYITSLVDNH